jgi:hypothetical protein
VKYLVILAKRKPNEKRPAKTNFDAWRAAQTGPLGKVPTKPLNFSSTCRLVNFPFECTQRGAQLLPRDIPVHNLLGLIEIARNDYVGAWLFGIKH